MSDRASDFALLSILNYKYQNLTDEYIEKHQNNLNWDRISMYHKVSPQFLNKFLNRINIDLLKKNKYFMLNNVDKA
jgi:hypothetical protein